MNITPKKLSFVSVLMFLSILILFDDQVYDWVRGFFDPEGLFLLVFLFSPSVLLFSVVSMFRPVQVFHSWWKFVKYYVSVSAIIVFLFALSDATSGLGYGADIDAEIITWWLASLFLLISLIIIITKSIKLRNK